MAKRSRKQPNPVYQKGYVAGFNDGKHALVDLIAGKLEELRGAPGIGPKTWARIENTLMEIEESRNEQS